MNDDDLDQTIQAFQSVIESMLASHAMLQAQVEVLESNLADALERLGLTPPTHQSFVESLRHQTIECCNQKLAHIADDQPGMASRLKSLIDDIERNSS